MSSKKVLIIAEAGVNHNGSVEIAKKLIDVAKNAGADVVKFQTFITESVISKLAPKASYQIANDPSSDSQYQLVKKLELSFEDFRVLKSYCDEVGIEFLSTAFDDESMDFLKSLKPNYWKIPSGEITNLLYLEYISRLDSKVIMSTGMASLQEVQAAYDVLINGGTKKENLTILHCNTEYPTPYSDVNLNAMSTIKNHFQTNVGYSDHTLGIDVSIAAVALGAMVIEKHFTLSREMSGPDHRASLEPLELKALVTSIRNVEKSLGSFEKISSSSEEKNKAVARRSIVAKTNIKKGEIFTKENITLKRPGNGISPMEWYNVLGKQSRRDYLEDELI